MSYLNDIIGLLSLRDKFGFDRKQLEQRAKEFEAELGFSREQALRAAQQWEQQFRESQARRAFEQQQQQNVFNQQLAQQNFLQDEPALRMLQQQSNRRDALRSGLEAGRRRDLMSLMRNRLGSY